MNQTYLWYVVNTDRGSELVRVCVYSRVAGTFWKVQHNTFRMTHCHIWVCVKSTFYINILNVISAVTDVSTETFTLNLHFQLLYSLGQFFGLKLNVPIFAHAMITFRDHFFYILFWSIIIDHQHHTLCPIATLPLTSLFLIPHRHEWTGHWATCLGWLCHNLIKRKYIL